MPTHREKMKASKGPDPRNDCWPMKMMENATGSATSRSARFPTAVTGWAAAIQSYGGHTRPLFGHTAGEYIAAGEYKLEN